MQWVGMAITSAEESVWMETSQLQLVKQLFQADDLFTLGTILKYRNVVSWKAARRLLSAESITGSIL